MQSKRSASRSGELLRRYRKTLRQIKRLRAQDVGTLKVRRRLAVLTKRVQYLAERLNPFRRPVVQTGLLAMAAAFLGHVDTQASSPYKFTDLSPATNALNVANGANIVISFSNGVDVPTATGANIRVYGSQTGLISESGLFSGTVPGPVTFNPAADFQPGELISVTLTENILDDDGNNPEKPQVFSFTAAVDGGEGEFTPAGIIRTATYSKSVEIGDLDGDGDLDILHQWDDDGSSYAIESLLNDGSGSFTLQQSLAIRSDNIETGDLDGDGDLDVVLPSVNSSKIPVILLNNGDGTFTSQHIGSNNAFHATVGDMDKDGDLDIIMGLNVNALQFFRNNGDATFVSSTYGVHGGFSITDVKNGDLDGDGDLDVVFKQYSGSEYLFLFNNGDFGFSSSTMTGASARAIDLGDIDGDGDLDMVTSAFWLNDGSGTFTSQSSAPTNAAGGLRLGDLDGDGDLDVALVNFGGTDNQILINNGDGTFGSSTFKSDSHNNRRIALGDLDGDGDLDAVSAVYLYNQGVELWLNGSNGPTFSPAKNTPAAACDADITITYKEPMNTSTLTSATVPNNANLIVYGMQTGHITTKASISYEDDGTRVRINPASNFKPGEQIMVTVTGATTFVGELQPAAAYSFTAEVKSGDGRFEQFDPQIDRKANIICVGDLDGDGDIDAVLGDYFQNLIVLHNDGSGTLTEVMTTPFSVEGLALGDLDGDGDIDIAANESDDDFHLFYNDGDGQSFTLMTVAAASSGDKGIALGDLDGDGDLDLVAGDNNDYYNTSILWNDGDGNWTNDILGSGAGGYTVALGDLDGDCDLDIIRPDELATGHNQIWFNNGDGTFNKTSFGSGGYWDAKVGDLDNDGDLDVVLSGVYSYLGTEIANALWLNNGDGTFASSEFGREGIQRNIGLGDVDGDGDLDMILTREYFMGNPGDASLQVYLNNGDATFDSYAMGATNAGRNGIALGDLDGDGDLEILSGGYTNDLESWNNGIPPEIHAVSSGCLFTTTGSLALDLTGLSLGDVTAATLTLPNNSSIGLVVASSTATMLATEIPAGSALSSGTYTLKLYDLDGMGSTTFSISALPSVSGTLCGCPETPLTYTAEPPAGVGDADSWSISGGVILSGQGTSTVVVEWNQGGADKLTLNRTFAAGCTTAVVLNVAPKTLIVNPDVKQVAAGETADVDALDNDSGDSLSLKTTATPDHGSASISEGEITYTADAGFNGLDVFDYSVEDGNGCVVTSAVVMVVGNACLPGNLQFVEREKDRKNGVLGLNNVGNTAISPDGKHLYAAGCNDHSIVLFNRSSTDGTIEYVDRYRHGHGGVNKIRYVSDLAFSPEGDHLYAVSYGDNSLVAFSRDDEDGTLTQIQCEKDNSGGFDGLKGASAVAVSPDGENIYVAGKSEHSIAVMQQSGGMFVFLERLKDGSDGVDGLKGVCDVAISPDGKHVYAAGSGDDAVAVFSRSASDGSLTFIERHRDNKNGVNGLAKAVAVKVSADGRHVYVAGNGDDAVAVFARNDSSGALTYVNDYSDRDAGVAGLDGAADVAVGFDGFQVYASGEGDNAVAHFSRKPVSGELNFEERKKDGKNGVDGLRGAKGIEVSRDSKFVYVAGSNDDAVAVFYRNLKPIARDDDYTVMTGVESLPSEIPVDNSVEFCVLDNDVEIDGDQIKITSVTNPGSGEAALNADSTKVRYTPPGTSGLPAEIPASMEDEFSYTISDGRDGSSTATVTVQLGGAPYRNGVDAPAATSGPALLEQLTAAPNPTQGDSRIEFRLNRNAAVHAEVRDLTGRSVAQLLDDNYVAGEYRIEWNGSDGNGRMLTSGMYYIVLQAADGNETIQRVVPLVLAR